MTDEIAATQAANDKACNNAARKAGYSQTQAEWCDNGGLNCPECPWKPETMIEGVLLIPTKFLVRPPFIKTVDKNGRVSVGAALAGRTLEIIAVKLKEKKPE